MQINVTENGIIKISLAYNQGSLFGGYESSEEYTGYELGKLIQQLSEARKLADKKRKGLKS